MILASNKFESLQEQEKVRQLNNISSSLEGEGGEGELSSSTPAADIYSIAIVFLQLNNIVSFSFDTQEERESEEREFFRKGVLPDKYQRDPTVATPTEVTI